MGFSRKKRGPKPHTQGIRVEARQDRNRRYWNKKRSDINEVRRLRYLIAKPDVPRYAPAVYNQASLT